jgi:hypothetical protein
MLNSKLGLFEITGTDRKEGYVYLKEVFTGAEYKITDIALSVSMNWDSIYNYTRIITYHDINFGSGLSLTFLKADPFIKDFIQRQKKNYYPTGDLLRLSELYNRYSHDSNRVEVVTNTL